MAKQIIVNMRGSDSIEQILPYLEEVAQPGMKVVFLIHCGIRGFKHLIDVLLATHAGIEPRFLPGGTSQDIWEENKDSIQREINSACQALTNKGIEIGINVYAGRRRRIIRECLAKGNVHLVLMRPRGGNLLRKLLQASGPVARLFKPPFFAPVILLHPNQSPRQS